MARLRLTGLVTVALLAIACGDDVTITIDPTTKSLLPGESVTFTATVTGSDDTSVKWSIKEGASGGMVSDGGVYTAPARSGQYTVVATANADTTKTASASVTVATTAVLLTGTAPVSPSNDNNPMVQGTAESGAAVKIFAGDDCNGVPVGSGVAGVDGRFEIAVAVPADSTTTFRARVTSAGGVTSECSTSSIEYVEDSTSPSSAIVFGTSVSSPGRVRDVEVEGTSEAHAKVRVFLDGACEGESVGVGTADDSGAFAVPVRAPANATSRFYVRPEDQAGNVGPCSATSALFTHDDVAPAEATFASTSPESPSSENTVLVVGEAEPGSTVALYDGSGCLLKVGEGTAEDFMADGVSALVQDDRTTRFHAIVTDEAGNSSACSSTSIIYVEDSTVDAPALDLLTPSSPSPDRFVTLIGTAEELATVELYGAASCTGTAIATASASGSGSFEFTFEAVANTTSTWSARTIDLASNVSSCSAAVTFTHDDEPPAAPRVSAVSPASPAADTTPVISGSAEDATLVRLYATSNCTGAVVAQGAAIGGAFSFEVTVEADSTNRFHATATDAAGNVSACSTSFVTYVEQSSAVVTLTVEPAAITLAPGDHTVFVAEVSGTTNLGVEWAVEEEGGGTISASGDYVAPAQSGTYHVVATSVANRSVTARAEVTVVDDAPSITVEPASTTLFVGQSFTFSAATARFEGNIVWEVSTPGGGFVSPDGVYWAPQLPGRYVVVARSEDGAVRGAATVEVKLPEITGVVQAPEGVTGRVFISVRETGDFARWEPVAGTSIESPGEFTVRGLSRTGTYRVEARMPASGVPSEATVADPYAWAEVDLTQGVAESVTLVLAVDGDEARPPPDFLQVVAHGTSALAVVGQPTDGEDRAYTDTCRIYLSTSSPATAENALFSRDVTGRESLVVLPVLEPGVEYFASAVCVYSDGEGPATTFGPFGATEPPADFAVSGQVHIEGEMPQGSIFVVAVADDDSPRFTRVSGTSSPFDYHLSGMPEGPQQITVIADLDGDGLLFQQEMASMEAFARAVNIDGSDVTGFDLFVRYGSTPTRLKVSTFASYATPGSGHPDHYGVQLRAESGGAPLVRASVVGGPFAGLPYDMAVWPYGGPTGFVFSPPGSSQRPVEGTTYSVEAVDADGQVHLLTGVLERVLDAPVATSPSSLELSTTPDFSWTLAQPLPEGSRWGFQIFEREGSTLWSVWDRPASNRTVAWNDDGSANVEALNRGGEYSWELEVRDPDENSARIRFDFAVSLSVEVTPSSLTLAPGGVQTLLGEVLGSPDEGVIFSVDGGNGTIDAQGNYTAPATPGIYTITARAADHLDVVTTVTVTVVDAPQIAVTPEPQLVSVAPGASVQLNAVVSGTPDRRLTWRVAKGSGQVDETGRFQAPQVSEVTTVVATSVADPSRFAVFYVTADSAVPTLTLSTTSLRLAPGESETIDPLVTGYEIAWQVLDGPGPTVTDGLVVAGDVPGNYRVVASLVEEPSVTATVDLVVAHPDVSGTVVVDGPLTGKIVVQLFPDNGDYPLAGTVLDEPGTFVLRGVSHRGAARLVAWQDSSGLLTQKNSDHRVARMVNLSDQSQTGLVLDLMALPPEAPGAPQLEIVQALDSGAFVLFDPPMGPFDVPTADSHQVLVSTNATPDLQNALVVDVPAGSDSAVFVPSLVNGESYYFRVAAVSPGGTTLSEVVGPVTIGAPVGGTTVSGVITSVGVPTGPMYVGVLGDSLRFVRIDAPSDSQAFTIAGVPAGPYDLIVLRDANANGTIEAGEAQRGETFEVADQPVVGLTLGESPAPFRASVQTRVHFEGTGTTYGLTFRVEQGTRLVKSVSIVDGPEFPLGADLGFLAHGVDREFVRDHYLHDRPVFVGQTWKLLVNYLDGGSEETEVSVTRVWSSAPTALLPVGTGSIAPTFSWVAPEAPASSTFTYYLGVARPFSGHVWWVERMPSTQTSIEWNADGEASLPSLTLGESYSWMIGVEDEDGNRAQASASFTVQ